METNPCKRKRSPIMPNLTFLVQTNFLESNGKQQKETNQKTTEGKKVQWKQICQSCLKETTVFCSDMT